MKDKWKIIPLSIAMFLFGMEFKSLAQASDTVTGLDSSYFEDYTGWFTTRVSMTYSRYGAVHPSFLMFPSSGSGAGYDLTSSGNIRKIIRNFARDLRK
jgi:hypothetical protein